MKITQSSFKPHKGNYGLKGFLELEIDSSIFLDGILVYAEGNRVWFKTPAKKLQNGTLVPFYSFCDKALEARIIKIIKEKIQTDFTLINKKND